MTKQQQLEPFDPSLLSQDENWNAALERAVKAGNLDQISHILIMHSNQVTCWDTVLKFACAEKDTYRSMILKHILDVHPRPWELDIAPLEEMCQSNDDEMSLLVLKRFKEGLARKAA